MDETTLRHALLGAVDEGPPPMAVEPVLRAAHRSRRRRTGALAAAGTALTAVAVLGGSTLVPGADFLGTAAGPTSTTGGDQTVTAGPEAARADALFELATSVVPAGLTPGNPGDRDPHRQAYTRDHVNWEYSAQLFVQDTGGRWGEIIVEVHRPGLPTTGCPLARTYWGMGGECAETTVDGKVVGVVTPVEQSPRLDQWAAYRHPDGTVVFVAQAKQIVGSSKPPLTAEPYPAQRLAELATDPRFVVA